MDDLIIRQAAIDAFCKECYDTDGEICDRDDVCGIVMILRNLPSAQPEVIRCKDCKWFNDIGCAIRIVDDTDKPSEEDYCSYAERREE